MIGERLSEISFAVFAKGLRVTRDNEEFQRIWPREFYGYSLQDSTAQRLSSWDGWPDLVAELYRMRPSKIDAQQCLLLEGAIASVVVARRLRDAHRRPTVFFVCASTSVTWAEPDLTKQIATLAASAHSVAETEGIRFEADASEYADSLRLRGAEVRVSAPLTPDLEYWLPIVREIERFQGIVGISTPALAPLGANVVIGTRHEASLVARQQPIAGFYLPQEERLTPIGSALTPWMLPQDDAPPPDYGEPKVPFPTGDASPRPDLDRKDLLDVAFGLEAAVREHNALHARRLRLYEVVGERFLDLLEQALRSFDRWGRSKK